MSEESTATIEAAAPVVAEPEAPKAEVVTPDATVTSGGDDFKQFISEDLRDHDDLKSILTINDMAKALVNSRQLIGKDKIVLPGEDATPEQLETFYAGIGRPDTPQDYHLAPPDSLPEGFTIQTELIDSYAEHAHSIGLTAKQAAAELAFQTELAAKQMEQQKKLEAEALQENETTLKNDFGSAYEQNIKLANQAIDRLSEKDESLRERLNSTGLGSDPAFVKMMVKMGKMMGESNLVGEAENTFARTPGAASIEIAKLQADEGFMKQYNTSADPNHKQAVERMRRLFVEEAGASNEVISSGGKSISST